MWSICIICVQDYYRQWKSIFSLGQDWGVQQKKANRSSEKNKKKLSAAVVESRLTNDISPESTPGAGRRRARTPHSFPHIKYTTQMSVPDQAELEKLRQRINFTDLDEVKKSCCILKFFVHCGQHTFLFCISVIEWVLLLLLLLFLFINYWGIDCDRSTVLWPICCEK